MRLRLRATQRDRDAADRDRRSAARRRRAGAGAAAPGRHQHAGVDPALRDSEAAAALPIGVPAQSDWFPSHVDVRDDRLVLYGEATRDVGTFVYRVRATNAGIFQLPPAFAEGMYNRT